MEVLRPDICVIGAGSGGLSVAAAAAAFGVPVVLVEHDRMGGECLNTGCVPSKALLAIAKRLEAVRDAGRFGIKVQRASVEFRQVRDQVRSVIAAVAPNDSKERFTGLGVRVIEGHARFKDARTVAIDDAEIEIAARRFVVATGSKPVLPPIPGLADVPHLTNETVFDLASLPKHLVVIGAGPVGLELAQAYRRLGAEVTVLEAERPLANDDPECAQILLDQLAREGIAVRAGVGISKIGKGRGKIIVTFATAGDSAAETVEGSHLLVAAGRQPVTEGLDLDRAGIKAGPHGISVDERQRTSNKRVYAIGDAAGGLRFTHVAAAHAATVIRDALFRLRPARATRTVPWVTYTDPELAQVGLTEAQARAKHRRIRILRWPYCENDRAQAERETRGHLKIVTTRAGKILGASIAGPGAGEMIGLWALALANRLDIRAVAELVLPYPTLAEIGKRAAMSYYTPRLTSPIVRRIMALFRSFG